MHVVWLEKINGGYYFNIPGADHLIVAPLPNGLFSIEDRSLHYDARVEASLLQPKNEPEGEEVKEEYQGPEQEQQLKNDFTTYEHMYVLEGSIENMSNIASGL
jgi:hypothetical protein